MYALFPDPARFGSLWGAAPAEGREGGGGDTGWTGRGGDDGLAGGVGEDVAVYRGAAAEYQVSLAAGFAVVNHLAPSGADDGNDVLTDVEVLGFAEDRESTRLNSSH